MKKGFFLFLALLISAPFPMPSHAQGVFGVARPGSLPAFGSGPSQFRGPSLFESPTFYVGWMESNRKASFAFDAVGPDSFFGGAHSWGVAGLWLGIAERINLSENLGIDLGGWVLIPSNRPGGEQEGTVRNIVTITIVEQEYIIETVTPTPTVGNRSWNTRTDWWYVDAAGAYGPTNALRVLGGFRYDHFSTRFDNPASFSLPSTSGDTADISVNSYLPYVGVQYSIGGPATMLKASLIGFPWAPANVTHLETGEAGTLSRVESTGHFYRSYFWELFAEYNRNFSPTASMGAFFRWNVLHGQANLGTHVHPADIQQTTGGASFDRNTITFGGSFSLNFASPF